MNIIRYMLLRAIARLDIDRKLALTDLQILLEINLIGEEYFLSQS